jgi:hypothetical protein
LSAAPISDDTTDLAEGCLVHYVLPRATLSPGEHRPAIVVKVWRHPDGSPPPNGCANLQVFTDNTNDYNYGDGRHGLLWATTVLYNADGIPGTWHWPERS